MGATQQRQALASYRDAASEVLNAGESLGDIEDAIDDIADLTMSEEAALWLLAFSRRERAEQQRDARAHLAALA